MLHPLVALFFRAETFGVVRDVFFDGMADIILEDRPDKRTVQRTEIGAA
jgi:hypothetical protein